MTVETIVVNTFSLGEFSENDRLSFYPSLSLSVKARAIFETFGKNVDKGVAQPTILLTRSLIGPDFGEFFRPICHGRISPISIIHLYFHRVQM